MQRNRDPNGVWSPASRNDGPHRFWRRRLGSSFRGQHVELIDDDQTPDAEQLVRLMDDHIEDMSSLLGVTPPVETIGWVRGSMFGENGRATGRWALCGDDDNPASLTSLDRHEVAHSLIFLLDGPYGNTPTLLVEGWAESQSGIRDKMIRRLASDYRANNHITLDELVQPEWYNSTRNTVYSHGGPFAIFLLERYGGEKFF